METKKFLFGDNIDSNIAFDHLNGSDLQEVIDESTGISPIGIKIVCTIFILIILCVVCPIFYLMSRQTKLRNYK